MPKDFYARFVEEAVAGHAQDAVKCGRWDPNVAAEKSLAELQGFLAQGLDTPGHHLFVIEREIDGATLGTVWFGETTRNGQPVAYVYDIRIYPPHRRRGYATAALALVETRARTMGLGSMVLHAFGHNTSAIALYDKLGFATTDVIMAKRLRDTP